MLVKIPQGTDSSNLCVILFFSPLEFLGCGGGRGRARPGQTPRQGAWLCLHIAKTAIHCLQRMGEGRFFSFSHPFSLSLLSFPPERVTRLSGAGIAFRDSTLQSLGGII